MKKRLIFVLTFFFTLITNGVGESGPFTESSQKQPSCSIYVKISGKKIISLDFEKYLEKVVQVEMGGVTNDLNALKAQSIISRTYALSKMQSKRGLTGLPPEEICKFQRKDKKYFDVMASTSSQVYDEEVKIKKQVEEAVHSTRELILLNKEEDREIPVIYFHAHCGGSLIEPEEVWGNKTSEFGVCGDSCAHHSNDSAWSFNIKIEELKKVLLLHVETDKKNKIKKDFNVVVFTFNDLSQRLEKVELYDVNGQPVRFIVNNRLSNFITGNTFRTFFSKKNSLRQNEFIKSTLFNLEGFKHYSENNDKSTVSIDFSDLKLSTLDHNKFSTLNYSEVHLNDMNSIYIEIKGKGYGHGTGLCQYGAIYKASILKWNFIEILSSYFPNLKITNLKYLKNY